MGLGGGSQRPPNTYPLWRYLLLIIVLGVAAVYALPNLYPPDHALQVKPVDADAVADAGLLQRSAELLADAGIEIKGQELAGGNALLRVDSNRTQLAGKTVLNEALNPPGGADPAYTVALNLAPTTPLWLRELGGKPMSLGLDLSGGVHFLLQVDMDTFLGKRSEEMAKTIESLLRAERIRAVPQRRGSWASGGNNIRIPFQTEAYREEAWPLLNDPQNVVGYDITRDTVGGRPGIALRLSEERQRILEDYAIDQNLESLRKRVNELGVSEPLVQQLGRSRIVIDLPGMQDSTEAKKIINKFANLEFRLVAANTLRDSEVDVFPYEGRNVRLEKENIVTGSQVTNAVQDYDPESGLPQVSIELDAEGGPRMNEISGDNIGNQMAVLFLESKTRELLDADGRPRVDEEGKPMLVTTEDKRLINVATIRAALGYNFRITGLDSLGEARELALLLRAGALAAPMYIVEERTVGAQLGDDNIRNGFLSLQIGLGLVALFMLFYYRLFGVAAVCALGANIVLIVAIMSILGATLTLPGIAGIVLTIGMAVDANVLIFSRIREELQDRAPQAAIQAGFDRAFVTILDANVTTFFVAIILLSIGSGPVKGFAITLAIGIATSMFTAIMGTRAIVNLMYGGRKLTKLAI
ncbi:MAG: protein translocase subunit SecD [Pseudomonadota bacterium]